MGNARTLVVTGGSRGIGAATVRRAAAAGWPVCFGYRDDAAAARAIETEVVAAGGRAYGVRADVAVERDIVALFETAERLLGPLGGLVCNAGITGGFCRVEDLSAERLNAVLAVNVAGPMLCAREAVRRLSTARGGPGGAIVTVSSTATKAGSPNEWVHYAASKGAVDVFTGGLAREVAAEGIRVNAVAPGLVATDIHAAAGDPGRPVRMASQIPMARAGTPEEIAEAIVWLLSDAASYVTGAVIPVSGGR